MLQVLSRMCQQFGNVAHINIVSCGAPVSEHCQVPAGHYPLEEGIDDTEPLAGVLARAIYVRYPVNVILQPMALPVILQEVLHGELNDSIWRERFLVRVLLHLAFCSAINGA